MLKLCEMHIEKPFPELTFERMQLCDLEQVLAIEQEVFPTEPWDISIFQSYLQDGKEGFHLYVARLNDAIIGYIVFWVCYDEAHILNIAVTDPYRRRGVATYLLGSALEIIQGATACEVFLEVAMNNVPARKLYHRFGFQPCGIRKEYYSNGEDAYVLRKIVEAV